ncbi:MAG TPA: hypothetical protein VH280_08625 [Verrucomicrobiae bacterium]|jgi:hypothetical protein|nr:hypothetical protein [Verrucomicrobiae bacterium]
MNLLESFSIRFYAPFSYFAKRHGVRRQPRKLSGDAAFDQHSTHVTETLCEPATAFQSGVTATALQDRAVVRQVVGQAGHWTCFSKLFFNKSAFFLFPLSFFLITAVLVAPAQSTNDSDTTTTDFSSFQVISERNIFNPDRYGRTTTRHYESRSVPTFSLAGTMSYRKGMFAFFDGTREEYRKALQQGGIIAGYTIGKINFDGVELRASGITNYMRVGAAMRREGDAWEMSAPGEWGDMASANGTGSGSGSDTNNGTSTNSNSNTALPSGGEQNDVLKRLMEKREQELK